MASTPLTDVIAATLAWYRARFRGNVMDLAAG
jgi:hypothetical protein